MGKIRSESREFDQAELYSKASFKLKLGRKYGQKFI